MSRAGTDGNLIAPTGRTYRTAAGTTVETRGVLGLTRTDNGTATVDYTYDPAGVLLARHTATDDDYYLYDRLGSTAAVTGPTGTTANRYTYDPYGTVTTATETIDNPWQYVGAHGYHTDTATGLVKVGLRYYQPDHARWTQPDPTGQEANSYLYAAANPCSKTDPTGGMVLLYSGAGTGATPATPANVRPISYSSSVGNVAEGAGQFAAGCIRYGLGFESGAFAVAQALNYAVSGGTLAVAGVGRWLQRSYASGHPLMDRASR